ncbi:MAG TPA: GTPase Era [Candidatus Fimiplasma intestinipullorum]|uniref:GTPase Era n=1 Tax=Candidatus Fimiplasma intestinipullorum TaxID=2840825 RepID=A0A9D1HPG9_9FIRM|nr:GTPase Era [Candidatus Fimiplasma intestinipullorum]
MFKSGFVAIVGRPNVGKSTLLNHLLKKKVAIMSNVAQTTRTTLQGIYTDDKSQIIFIDTPGVHRPQDLLGNFMNTTAINSVYGTDVVLFMSAANEYIGQGDRYILNKLKEQEAPVFLVLNKVDLIKKEELIQVLNNWQKEFDFAEIIPISSLQDENLDTLLEVIRGYLNEGIKYYDENQLTDHSDRYLMAEYIREKILFFTHEEVPHSVAIVIERYEEFEDHYEIMATIVVNRSSQKGIIIGKQGSMIQKIRQAARKDMKRYLGKRVDLELFVRVEKDWRNKQRYLKEFGYDEEDY